MEGILIKTKDQLKLEIIYKIDKGTMSRNEGRLSGEVYQIHKVAVS